MERINTIDAYGNLGIGKAFSDVGCQIIIEHARKRDGTYTAAKGGTLALQLDAATAGIVVTGITLAQRADGKTAIQFAVDAGTPLTAGATYTLIANNDTAAYIDIINQL